MADSHSAMGSMADAVLQRAVEGWVSQAACTTLTVAVGVAAADALVALLLRRGQTLR